MKTEQDLISGLKEGNEEAFNLFFDRYKNTIYNFGLRFCGNPEDASDILQDTLVNTFKYIKNFQGQSKLSTWLYRVASNACLLKRRKMKKDGLSLDEIEEEHETVSKDERFHPHNELEKKEMTEFIEKAILDLPENYRIPFILKEIENLSHEEIAEILEMSVSNAKVRVHRARLMLRDMVSDYMKREHNGM